MMEDAIPSVLHRVPGEEQGSRLTRAAKQRKALLAAGPSAFKCLSERPFEGRKP